VRFLRIFLAGALISAPVWGFEVTLNDEEREECRAGQGCMLVTRVKLREALELAFEAGREAQKVVCRSGA